MLNQVYLLGRIVNELVLEKNENHNYLDLFISVTRNYKNNKGEYDTDIIKCLLVDNIAKNTIEYCQKGDLVGIKGRLECLGNELTLVSEKVSFLSRKAKEEN